MQTVPFRLAAVALCAAVSLAGCSNDADDPDESDGSDAPAASSGSPSDREITLPDSLGDLLSFEAACAELDGNVDQCQDNAADRQEVAQAAADNLSAAYDGASTAAGEYASEGLEQFARVLAVAARSPGLWTTESDVSAEYTQIGHPREWVEERDGAQCVVVSGAVVPKGEELDPDNVIVTRCQATGDGLTVFVFPTGGPTLDEALEWTSEAFDAAK